MASKYKVNPVKATCMKYPGKSQDLQNINDTCFGICAAFSGTTDVFNMDPACSKSCTDLVEKRKKEIFGVGSCDHQAPYRPVIWDEIPRFIPRLVNKGIPLQEAKRQCMEMCKNVPMLDRDCMDMCTLDANAVEEYSPTPELHKKKTLTNEPSDPPSGSPLPSEENDRFFSTWLCILISIILFLSVVVVIKLKK